MNDGSDLDLLTRLQRNLPQGPAQGDDSAIFATALVRAVDIPGRRVRVTMRSGDIWLPAAVSRYKVGALCRVLIDPTASRPVAVFGAAESRSPIGLGVVTAAPSGGKMTVRFEGTDYVLDVSMGAYSMGGAAWVLLDDWGIPTIVYGPSSLVVPGVTPPAGGGTSPTVVNAKTTIGPQSTGTWRASRSSWDTWGNDIGGGVADIYQGDQYGSGPLTGLACYGDQVVNLGAIEITSMVLTATRNSSGTGDVALSVRSSGAGERPAGAPSAYGSVITTDPVSTGETVSVALPAAVREDFRTGAAKGLAAVGIAYAGFGGTTRPGSFTLAIEYTRNA